MRERPPHVSDDDVLAAVRTHWDGGADDVEHLPVGFGAHHWRARVQGRTALFVTLDALGTHHDATSLEAAYAGAAALAFRLDFVVAGLPTHDLRYTVPFAGGALSCTPWVWGERSPDPLTAAATAVLLARMHAVTPPSGIRGGAARRPRPRRTTARVGDDRVGRRAARRAGSGRRGRAPRRHRDRTARYRVLVEAARERPWVVTHGEPHVRNQLATPVRTLLVDWESVRLAPAERDLRWLPSDLVDADPAMLELFDLEWWLDEVSQYADRFAAPHAGGEDDETALAGLLDELSRA